MMKRLISLVLSAQLCFCLATAALAEPETTYTAWLPYWEADGSLAEAEALTDRVGTFIAFGAIFDAQDRPLMLPDADALLRSLQEQGKAQNARVLLSIVNDVEVEPEKYENKSVELLKRLFADEESASLHIERLFRLVDEYHLSGLELDYEALRSDTELWASYAAAIERLYEQFSAQGLTLRVVLSWDAPKYATLPEGPEYSVMCYNLYGYHSGPGPKADLAFLRETCALYAGMPNVHMAFATGGFDWHGDQITALTQTDAEALLADADITPTRDLSSGALYATFLYGEEYHTLWYADAETLSQWRAVAAEYGFTDIDLFRLDGNNLEDWRQKLL